MSDQFGEGWSGGNGGDDYSVRDTSLSTWSLKGSVFIFERSHFMRTSIPNPTNLTYIFDIWD